MTREITIVYDKGNKTDRAVAVAATIVEGVTIILDIQELGR